jgi:hypothetical protein
MATPKRRAPAGETGGTLSNRGNPQGTPRRSRTRRYGWYHDSVRAYPDYSPCAKRPLGLSEARRIGHRFLASRGNSPEAVLGEIVSELGLDDRRRWSA